MFIFEFCEISSETKSEVKNRGKQRAHDYQIDRIFVDLYVEYNLYL